MARGAGPEDQQVLAEGAAQAATGMEILGAAGITAAGLEPAGGIATSGFGADVEVCSTQDEGIMAKARATPTAGKFAGKTV